MHDIGDLLVAAGFTDPVMDMEMIALAYSQPRRFLADQRQLGVRDGMLGHMGWRDWRRIFRDWQSARDLDGRCPISFEVVFGHAWKAEARTTVDGRAVIHFVKP
jgi:malonyl-CoA O-methyltransferase